MPNEESIINHAKSKPKISFPKSLFKGISKEAQDFIAQLLNTDYKKRVSASEALNHPWLKKGKVNKAIDEQTAINANEVLGNMKKFRVKGKMRHAILGFITNNVVSRDAKLKYENIFVKLDVDNGGSLSREEIKNGAIAFFGKDDVNIMNEEDLD